MSSAPETAQPAAAGGRASSPAGAPLPESHGLAPSERRLSGPLGALPLPQQVLRLAIWPLMEQLLNFGVGFVDTYLAGHLSVAATSAIGVGAYIGWLVNLLQMSVGVGAAAVISRAIGGRHRRVAHAALGQAMLLSVFMGLFTWALVHYGAVPITHVMGVRDEAREATLIYLRVTALGAPFSSLVAVGSACLRASGDTRSPFLVLTVINAINFGVSLALVKMGHGVWGIGMGTSLAWAVGACITVAVLMGGWGGIRLHAHRLRPHASTLRRVARVGFANVLEGMGIWSGNFILLATVGKIDSTGRGVPLAAHIVAIRIEAISFLPSFAVGIAASTLAGQYLGLSDPDRARRAVNLCWHAVLVVMVVLGAVFYFFAEGLTRLVTDQPEVLAQAPALLRTCGPVQVFLGSAIVLSNALRGAGDTRMTMKLTYLTIFLVRVPLAYLLAIPLGLGLHGLWIGLCTELVFRGVVFSARYLHGGWVRVRV